MGHVTSVSVPSLRRATIFADLFVRFLHAATADPVLCDECFFFMRAKKIEENASASSVLVGMVIGENSFPSLTELELYRGTLLLYQRT